MPLFSITTVPQVYEAFTQLNSADGHKKQSMINRSAQKLKQALAIDEDIESPLIVNSFDDMISQIPGDPSLCPSRV